MNLLTDLGRLLLEVPLHLANGLLLTAYWLGDNLPALISLACAGWIAFTADHALQAQAGRPARAERNATDLEPRAAQITTAVVALLWLAAQSGMAAPVPWIGAVMWLVGLLAVFVLQAQRINILWQVKSGVALYALAVLAGRIYLTYTARLSSEQWAALIGSAESAQAIIANTRGNITTIILWALWLVVPLGFFAMLFQQMFLNPLPVTRPLSGAASILESLRYRGGR